MREQLPDCRDGVMTPRQRNRNSQAGANQPPACAGRRNSSAVRQSGVRAWNERL